MTAPLTKTSLVVLLLLLGIGLVSAADASPSAAATDGQMDQSAELAAADADDQAEEDDGEEDEDRYPVEQMAAAKQRAASEMHRMDADGDGVISLAEFMAAGGSQSVFDRYDGDGSGTVDRDELEAEEGVIVVENSRRDKQTSSYAYWVFDIFSAKMAEFCWLLGNARLLYRMVLGNDADTLKLSVQMAITYGLVFCGRPYSRWRAEFGKFGDLTLGLMALLICFKQLLLVYKSGKLQPAFAERLLTYSLPGRPILSHLLSWCAFYAIAAVFSFISVNLILPEDLIMDDRRSCLPVVALSLIHWLQVWPQPLHRLIPRSSRLSRYTPTILLIHNR